ncbi:MAG: DNA polymerase subunit beta [Thermoplasmata archaeon HGW-Thermoplasmata-1]|nr:MAG: DNA polymerase subunit beta [Thermoplasmata archaeon HGW-Thermoplasmata-1]
MKPRYADIDVDALVKECVKHNIRFMGIFGSYARGEQKKGSDMDILVEFSDKKSLFDLMDIEEELTEILGMPVDIVTKNALHPKIRDNILKELRVIFQQSA